ncbi:MAG: diguanylate cyclase [Pseudomonadota bacterium]
MALEEETEEKSYVLNPWTLHYLDHTLEQEYTSSDATRLGARLLPLIFLVVPFLLLFALLELVGVVGSLVRWPGILCLVLVLVILAVTVNRAPRLAEPGLVLALVVATVIPLAHIHSDADLAPFLPGLCIVILLTQFVGLKFLHGVVASLSLLLLVTLALLSTDVQLSQLADAMLFLIPGLLVAGVAGYASDKQKRELFAHLKRIDAERSAHEQMALHDPLTGLPNRNLLRERMAQSVARARRSHGRFAVLFVDLDDFKSVNDSYGHAVGDRVLKEIAGNLLLQVRGEDTVARLGGDEFVVLSEQVQDTGSARIAAERIAAAVAKPIVISAGKRADTIHVTVTASIGIALCPNDGDSLEKLINRADEAMYHAKRDGKDTTRFFEPGSRVAGNSDS